MVGVVANADGLFSAGGRRLDRLPGGGPALLAACMAMVAVVTAVLNLDTSVVFLTPVLVLVARHRGLDEEPFLYSSVFMANSSSLFLPGSNLTNLLVLERDPISGGGFARTLLLPAGAAALATAVGIFMLFRRRFAGTETAVTPEHGPSPRLSIVAVAAVAVLTVALPEPALPVFGVGLLTAAAAVVSGRLVARDVIAALGLKTLAALFLVSVALGTLARAWNAPTRLVAHAGRWQTAAVGAVSSVLVNNLPAAVLLSAQELAHPRALLIGLNVGPNLAVTGSLSALLWFRAARQVGAEPSVIAFSRRGIVLAPLALVAAAGVAVLLGGSA